MQVPGDWLAEAGASCCAGGVTVSGIWLCPSCRDLLVLRLPPQQEPEPFLREGSPCPQAPRLPSAWHQPSSVGYPPAGPHQNSAPRPGAGPPLWGLGACADGLNKWGLCRQQGSVGRGCPVPADAVLGCSDFVTACPTFGSSHWDTRT